MKLSRETRKSLIKTAREMRKNPTEPEAVLWNKLRRRQLQGYKFRRQQVIGVHIVDFYCAPVKVVVEIDGEIHLQQKENDLVRDQHLGSLGNEVLRFSNQDVMDSVDYVLESILSVCLRREEEKTIWVE